MNSGAGSWRVRVPSFIKVSSMLLRSGARAFIRALYSCLASTSGTPFARALSKVSWNSASRSRRFLYRLRSFWNFLPIAELSWRSVAIALSNSCLYRFGVSSSSSMKLSLMLFLGTITNLFIGRSKYLSRMAIMAPVLPVPVAQLTSMRLAGEGWLMMSASTR